MKGERLKKKVTLLEAEKFHGHLGPYLVLGILAGEFALKKLGCKKYFGINIKVYGADKKPKSCLIDGLQLSSGATFGKGNIVKLNGNAIKIEFFDCLKNKQITLKLKENIMHKLKKVETHKDSEILAKELFKEARSNTSGLSPFTFNLSLME